MLSALVFVCVLRRCLSIRIRLGIIRVLSSIRIFSSAFYPPSAFSHPRFILHPHYLIRVLSSIRIFSSVFSHPHPYPPSVSASVSAFYPYPPEKGSIEVKRLCSIFEFECFNSLMNRRMRKTLEQRIFMHALRII